MGAPGDGDRLECPNHGDELVRFRKALASGRVECWPDCRRGAGTVPFTAYAVSWCGRASRWGSSRPREPRDQTSRRQHEDQPIGIP